MDAWERLIRQIKGDKGLVFLLGAAHSGKTTLAKFLAYTLSQEGEQVALLDGDIGQSIFGPPTTLSLAFLPIQEENNYLYFIGSNTPSGHFLPLIVGLKKLVDRAYEKGSNITIIDTTGFVSGGAAIELKRRKIELLQPRHLVALQRANEVEAILQGLPERFTTIHRLPIHPKARIKTPEERQAHRQKKYAEYFQELREYEFELNRVRLWGEHHLAKDVLRILPMDSGLLLGLNDKDNFTLAVGILQELNTQEGKIRILAPPFNSREVKVIHFGAIRINRLGQDRPVRTGLWV